MQYSQFVELYEDLASTSKKLEKAEILSKFLPKLKGKEEFIYLLRGRVFPGYDEKEFGISTQLAIKAISKATGSTKETIVEHFKKIGDLGDVAEKLIETKKETTLVRMNLTVDKLFKNFRMLVEITGKGTVEKKVNYVVELLTSASGKSAKYIIRTVLNDLRVGVADGILREGIAKTYFKKEEKEGSELIESALDKINDFAEVLKLASKGKNELKKVEIVPGRPIKVMLPVKVTNLEEAFRICGKPLAVEHKYDGFRVLINYNGKEISLFTRRLDNVTKQFPDVVKVVKKHVNGKSFVLDSEIVGYDPKKKKYLPFEAISQRIRRKHEIDRLVKKLPVEITLFDIVYHNGQSIIDYKFKDRRKLLEKIVKSEKLKIRLSTQFVSSDKKKIMKFYKNALKIGEEGVMFKKIDAPYRPGRRVGFMVKLKPVAEDLDLVIVGAEYGKGKRSGGLTSYTLACKSGKDFLEVGKVSSGLKEKEELGTSYKEMDKLLRPLIINEIGKGVKVKPKIVLSITYQNLQPSSNYNSGFALRFPKITSYRPERGIDDIATLEEIKKEFIRMSRLRKKGLG
ncbi:TPA: ATP-dependent DNA ligase [Candidatus Pacearchaeota archaeon]|nr:ATP-dependent DNA ligase [Candidatus Pacearchaeota archaeon]